ncbi:hypothetical protein GCM10022198_00480 [Klugiella xanthotipulae]|uniref:Uncharacterized protein n=1 Tax=Klugiella xanthotipulae TaxID=244735 RepID=A0A543I5C9_9MICO|nr:hypothetical protein [Klugiella xanthotipulae]TQM65813.1 hypothetical protein FB466_0626 [Klugiella xanthotipulae]
MTTQKETRLYSVRITSYPEGSIDYSNNHLQIIPSWYPPGWLQNPEEYERWVSRYNTARFSWPDTTKLYLSKSGARSRARLIESYGATAKILRTLPVVWETGKVIRARRIEELEAELSALYTEPTSVDLSDADRLPQPGQLRAVTWHVPR